MPEERNTAVPVMDKAAWDEARKNAPREMQAARLIVSRRIGGIPYRPYLNGDCDHAPVVKGVADFAAKVYDLVDAIDDANLNGNSRELPTVEEWNRIIDANANMVAAMEEFTL